MQEAGGARYSQGTLSPWVPHPEPSARRNEVSLAELPAKQPERRFLLRKKHRSLPGTQTLSVSLRFLDH